MKNSTEAPRLGAKVRALRRRQQISQSQLAEKLGISTSYLNLIENNHRPLPSPLLIKLAQLYQIDLHAFAADEDARLVADLMEAFSDPLFDGQELASADVRELAQASPAGVRAVLALYKAYQGARSAADDLSSRLTAGEETQGVERSHLPSEEVSELIQRYMNYFPELEQGAEELAARARLSTEDLYGGLCRHLERQHGIRVELARGSVERGTLRRFDPARRVLTLSELLPTRSRTFQLAYQVGLLTQRELLDRIASDPWLTSEASRTLTRVALGNYFAGCVLMPYEPFLRAAREERYDIDVIGRRFRVGFEQVCHRLTTLRRPNAEGVPFHMLRIDIAGNLSKRFSASGIRFARFSGACPKWNVFHAFLTPGMIRIQVSRMTDGATYFCIARTIQKDAGGFHQIQPVMAVTLGCRIEHAKQLVYADGVALDNPDIYVPVGVTCRLCERTDCEQRAMPSLKQALEVDENVRGVSLYATARRSLPRVASDS